MKRDERIAIFTEHIWQWYSRHKRELPWRDLLIKDDTQRAYQIMVSEIMLQQTQVERVKIVYRDFLEQFPSITDLSNASNKEMILAWRGMGYNNRALRLRDAALTICMGFESLKDEGGGVAEPSNVQTFKRSHCNFPKSMEDLQRLPGIGHYTASAIRNFAFDIPTPCIDTNIRRILHRVFVGPENADGTWKKDDRYLLWLAEKVLNEAVRSYDESFFRFFVYSNQRTNEPTISRSAADWHAALMDYGSLVCTKRNPKWDICPLTKAGIMKAAYKVPITNHESRITKKEPGRYVGSTYIPNRIFRGKVVDELRDTESGLSSTEIGKRICIDWDTAEHAHWLEGILSALKKDQLIQSAGSKYVLAD